MLSNDIEKPSNITSIDINDLIQNKGHSSDKKKKSKKLKVDKELVTPTPKEEGNVPSVKKVKSKKSKVKVDDLNQRTMFDLNKINLPHFNSVVIKKEDNQ